jgi:hypothetical protein
MATLKESTLEENYQKKVIEYDLTKHPVFIGCACTLCNVTVSTNHKFEPIQKCKCSNEVRIIGGFENPRVYAKNIKHTFIGIVYSDQDFDLVRQYASRGFYNEDGNLEFVRLNKVSDMNLVLSLSQGGAPWHLKLLAKEIQYRFENKIKIESWKK